MLKPRCCVIFMALITLATIIPGAVPTSGGVLVDRQATAANSDVKPSLSIVSPRDGSVLTGEAANAGETVTVIVELDHLQLTAPRSGEPSDNTGYLRYRLDERKWQEAQMTELTFDDVSPGEHTVIVEAVRNDGSRFDPPITDRVTFTRSQPTSQSWWWIAAGGFIVLGLFAWRYIVREELS